MSNVYSMSSSCRIGDVAVADVTNWLRNRPEHLSINNVENDKAYQEKDIDLIYHYTGVDGNPTEMSVEVKGDTYYKTGNFFFETVSNSSKNTPGCFMYTEADYLFYYFLGIKELYILPTEVTRKWFVDNMEDFKERATFTATAKGTKYQTLGRLVPRARVLEEVAGARMVKL